jgi:hypothetical protein
MKKFLVIGLIVGLVLVLAGGAGVVYARVNNRANNAVIQVNTSPKGSQGQQPFGYGSGGRMEERGFRGMMGGLGRGVNQGAGFLHDYIVSAFASAVGLTVDQVNTQLSNSESLVQIAQAQGFTGDKLTQLMTQVRQDALNQAVAAGVITQDQANQMLERMGNNSGFGFGPGFGYGNCPYWDDNGTGPTY